MKRPHLRRPILFRGLFALCLIAVLFTAVTVEGQRRINGFDLNEISVPRKFVKKGGPDRDGIPAIDDPKFIPANYVDFLSPSDRVLGLELEGVAKAYPLKILDRHEIVNDWFLKSPIVITYCPLCGSGIAFDANIDGRKSFSVSGLLYNSDVLMYDRETESLWSQIQMAAISGPLQDQTLNALPTINTTWEKWLFDHPDSLVLDNDQGIYRSKTYESVSYREYKTNDRIWFPVRKRDARLRPKDWVLGVQMGNEYKAYPLKALERAPSPLPDRLADMEFLIEYDPSARAAVAKSLDGEMLPTITLYWFSWYAFHPETELYKATEDY